VQRLVAYKGAYFTCLCILLAADIRVLLNIRILSIYAE
jgi:hypothetical protein